MKYDKIIVNETASDSQQVAGGIAFKYGLPTDGAVTGLLGLLSLGNGEPDLVFDECDPGASSLVGLDVDMLRHGVAEMQSGISMLAAGVAIGLVSVSSLACVLENHDIAELGDIRDALKSSASTLGKAQARRGALVQSRQAVLDAKLASIARFWNDHVETPAMTGFTETGQGPVPEPFSPAAFAVDCLAAAGCDYSHREVRNGLGRLPLIGGNVLEGHGEDISNA